MRREIPRCARHAGWESCARALFYLLPARAMVLREAASRKRLRRDGAAVKVLTIKS